MNILIVLGWGPREWHEYLWQAPMGATVKDSRQHLLDAFPPFKQVDPEEWQAAVWGKPVQPDILLKEGARVEWLRGLRVDPKVARRERFQKQGSRAAGLFASRRPGAKQGY